MVTVLNWKLKAVSLEMEINPFFLRRFLPNAGEGNTVPLGIELADKFGSYEGISVNDVTKAFNEPLTMQEVLSIAGLFIAE